MFSRTPPKLKVSRYFVAWTEINTGAAGSYITDIVDGQNAEELYKTIRDNAVAHMGESDAGEEEFLHITSISKL